MLEYLVTNMFYNSLSLSFWQINCSSIVSLLESIHLQDHKLVPSKRFKRNKHPTEYASALHQAALSTQESRLSVLMSLLDFLLLKKNLNERFVVMIQYPCG